MKADKTWEGAPPVKDVRSDFSAEESFKRLLDVGRRIVAVPREEVEKLERLREKKGKPANGSKGRLL
jgi:hypothetical protein